jgi:hypothetical protein
MNRDDRPFIDYLITEFDEGRMNLQTVIAKAILRGENKQWEDPNETQPKVGETVLLEVQDRNKPKKTVCTGWYGGKGHWYRYLPSGGSVPAYPLHWMLMPEPVREEDKL